MKAFIFDPIWNDLIDEEMISKLHEANIETILTTEIKPISETNALFEGEEDRLLCLNPDYVGWGLKNEDYEGIPNLKGILIASTGFEWIEREAADRLSIPICNIKDFSTQAVAEWAVMMMLSLARQTPILIKNNFPLDYDQDLMRYRGVQLKGKTAGIIGLGHVGSAIAELCKGLGMNVIYWSRFSSNEAYTKVPLEAVMATSDVIFPALAKNGETIALFDDTLVTSMKQSAILVDIAHMLINQDRALEMVKNNKLFGYGFEGKPEGFNTFDGNVWAAPAYAWATYESMHNSAGKLVENVILAAENQFPNKIN